MVLNKEKDEPIQKDPQAFIVEADTLQGFEIAGSDGIYVRADATITGKDTVDVWSPDVTNPVAVRYAWDNFPLSNLFNSEVMPASLFRTDKK